MERGSDHQQVGAVVELMTLSPIGLKSDHPSAAVPERLSSLAHAAAGLLNHTCLPVVVDDKHAAAGNNRRTQTSELLTNPANRSIKSCAESSSPS